LKTYKSIRNLSQQEILAAIEWHKKQVRDGCTYRHRVSHQQRMRALVNELHRRADV